MPKGGRRPGAGRKAGDAWDKPGIRMASRAVIKAALAGGRDPLTVLLDIAYDTEKPAELRMQAAAHAMPYMHPRLSMAVVADATPRITERDQSALVDEINARIGRLVSPAELTTQVTIEVGVEPT